MPSSNGCEKPADEPTQEDAEDRDFPPRCRGGGQRHDDPRKADEGGADDAEEQHGREQAGGRGAEERVEEAMHGVFAVDQVRSSRSR